MLGDLAFLARLPELRALSLKTCAGVVLALPQLSALSALESLQLPGFVESYPPHQLLFVLD